MLSQAIEVINNKNCVQFETVEGSFLSGNIIIKKVNELDSLIYRQIIPNVKKLQTTKWIKKRSTKPCKSKEIEDCMYWCLTKVDYYSFKDMKNENYDTESCPCNMKYDPILKQCTKQMLYVQKNAKVDYYLINKQNQKNLEIINWEVINCNP